MNLKDDWVQTSETLFSPLCYNIPISNSSDDKQTQVNDIYNSWPEINIKTGGYIWQIEAVHFPESLLDDELYFFYVLFHEAAHRMLQGTRSNCLLNISLSEIHNFLEYFFSREEKEYIVIPTLEVINSHSTEYFLKKTKFKLEYFFKKTWLPNELFSFFYSLINFSDLEVKKKNQDGYKYLRKKLNNLLDWQKEASLALPFYEKQFSDFGEYWNLLIDAYKKIGYQNILMLFRMALNSPCTEIDNENPESRLLISLNHIIKNKKFLQKLILLDLENELKNDLNLYFKDYCSAGCLKYEDISSYFGENLSSKLKLSTLKTVSKNCPRIKSKRINPIKNVIFITSKNPKNYPGTYCTSILNPTTLHIGRVKINVPYWYVSNKIFFESIRQQIFMGDGLICPFEDYCLSRRHYMYGDNSIVTCKYRELLRRILIKTRIKQGWNVVEKSPSRMLDSKFKKEVRWLLPNCLRSDGKNRRYYN